jgi:hypothetical protein
MQQGHASASAGIAAAEWPVPGFPQSYLSPLKVKSGNYPELGIATPGDVIVRVFKNASEHANVLSRILLRRLPSSPGCRFLLRDHFCSFSWAGAIRSGARAVTQDWHFAGYEFIYLLWPWDLEIRFFLPIVPLTCLYLWRGCQALLVLAKRKPRVLGAAWIPIAAVLAVGTWVWMHGLAWPANFRTLD